MDSLAQKEPTTSSLTKNTSLLSVQSMPTKLSSHIQTFGPMQVPPFWHGRSQMAEEGRRSIIYTSLLDMGHMNVYMYMYAHECNYGSQIRALSLSLSQVFSLFFLHFFFLVFSHFVQYKQLPDWHWTPVYPGVQIQVPSTAVQLAPLKQEHCPVQFTPNVPSGQTE